MIPEYLLQACAEQEYNKYSPKKIVFPSPDIRH